MQTNKLATKSEIITHNSTTSAWIANEAGGCHFKDVRLPTRPRRAVRLPDDLQHGPPRRRAIKRKRQAYLTRLGRPPCNRLQHQNCVNVRYCDISIVLTEMPLSPLFAMVSRMFMPLSRKADKD